MFEKCVYESLKNCVSSEFKIFSDPILFYVRNEIVKNNLHFKGVVARGAVLNYESGMLCHGGFKNRGLREWPLTENGDLSELAHT